MSSINNKSSYTLQNSDLVDITYTELELSVVIANKLSAVANYNKNVYIDENNIAIMSLNSTTNKYWLFDLSFSFNNILYKMMKNPRYHATNPFNLIIDIYDNRNPLLITTLTNQNINQAYEYIQYSGITPLSSLEEVYSKVIDFVPITLTDLELPRFHTRVDIDGLEPILAFTNDTTVNWILKADSNAHLQLLRGGTDKVLQIAKDTGIMSLSKNLTIENISPALLLKSTGTSGTMMGGMQSSLFGEVAVCSFTNHPLSFYLNGADPNLFYKMASMRLDKSMKINGGLLINKSTNDAAIALFDGVSGDITLSGQLLITTPSRISFSCNTFFYNIPTNQQVVIPFNQWLTSSGTVVTLDINTGKINLTRVGCYHVMAGWSAHNAEDVRCSIKYVIRRPDNTAAVGPTFYNRGTGTIHYSTTIQITSAPCTLEWQCSHLKGSDLQLSTSTSSGEYATYGTVQFLG